MPICPPCLHPHDWVHLKAEGSLTQLWTGRKGLKPCRSSAVLKTLILPIRFSCRPHTGASDLSFFLVMPVQRITKYPLLLQKILENTSARDKAYAALQSAASAMLEINANINEYKRRKEVGEEELAC